MRSLVASLAITGQLSSKLPVKVMKGLCRFRELAEICQKRTNMQGLYDKAIEPAGSHHTFPCVGPKCAPRSSEF
jgi:hypothetical protein